MRHTTIVSLFSLCLYTFARAGVGDPTLQTDHPHYPGEGAFQTAADCVAFATKEIKGEQERAIAVYQWLLTHQFHLHSPQEWNVPGVVPGAKMDDYEMVVYDAARGRFSYGYGLCGTVHAWNEPYWRALNMRARRRAFPGHTNSEIEYGGSWHAFDTDMAGLVFRDDGVVAGYEDIIKNPAIVKLNSRGVPCYPFAWPGDFNGMKQGWQQIAKNPTASGGWYKMYHSGYEAMPGIVHLRRGETFTRYFNRDHFGGPGKRRFWHVQKDGPFRDWTFVNQGEPKHDGAASNSRGNASYCNAEFVYKPDLATDAWREGVIRLDATAGADGEGVEHRRTSPHLRAAGGKRASVTFTHFSPYVICGDPEDDANPMTGRATGGLIVAGRAVGNVSFALSTNSGQSWQPLSDVSGAFEQDLTELAKGRHGWWLRFTMQGDAGLDALTFTTVCQTNQAIYPRLKPGGSKVTWRAASRAVLPMSPDFSLGEGQVAAVEEASLRSANLKYSPRSVKQRSAYTTTSNKPAQVTFKALAPQGGGGLLEVAAAARFQVRVPPPKGCDFRLEVSADGGRTWLPMARAEMPDDNEYSSGWMYGRASVPPRTQAALVRANLYAGGYTTGLISAEMYGIHATASPTAAKLTYAWKENGTVKAHTEHIVPFVKSHTFDVPTGKTIVDEYVKVEVP